MHLSTPNFLLLIFVLTAGSSFVTNRRAKLGFGVALVALLGLGITGFVG